MLFPDGGGLMRTSKPTSSSNRAGHGSGGIRKTLAFPGPITPSVGWTVTPTALTALVLVGTYLFRLNLRPDDLATQLVNGDDRWCVPRKAPGTIRGYLWGSLSHTTTPPPGLASSTTAGSRVPWRRRCEVVPLQRAARVICACAVNASTLVVGTSSGSVVVARAGSAGADENELVEVRAGSEPLVPLGRAARQLTHTGRGNTR